MNFDAISIECSPEGDWPELGSIGVSAARHLKDGGLLGHPTQGVYGLGGHRSEDCDAEIVRLKARPSGRGLVCLVFDVARARSDFPRAEWSPVAEKLAENFWPGPLTIVLPDGTPDGIAIRAECHPVTRAVLELSDRSLSSTSLNRSGEPPTRTGIAARATLSAMPSTDVPVLMLDVGDLGHSPTSTLVRTTAESFEILRQGAVPLSDLEAALQ